MNDRAHRLAQALNLAELPGEGGLFIRTFESHRRIAQTALGSEYRGDRPVGTAILYMLRAGLMSALHRLHSDELWHFYEGRPVTLSIIDTAGTLSTITLGGDFEAGEVRQAVIRGGCWFGGRMSDGDDRDASAYALMGCTVTPGFEYEDFELGDRAELVKSFPRHRAVIEALTRDS